MAVAGRRTTITGRECRAASAKGRQGSMTKRPPLAEALDLRPHPEGGWFRETFRSAVVFDPPGYAGPRAAATAIYFLLQPGESSAWHVVTSDELWLLHSGVLELRLGGSGPG